MIDLTPYITLLKQGEVVAFPTETVYGLGADARNPSAIKKIYRTKGRPADNPLIVHVSSLEQVKEFANEIPELAKKLMDTFWPGPLSVVLPKKPEVLDLITAGLDTVALRMPNHEIALSIIKQTGALVAPSANSSGKPSPTSAGHVYEDFGINFPVVDGGKTTIGLESTVVDCSGSTPSILRPGSVSKAQLESAAGVKFKESFNSKDSHAPKSPGQKYTHYKPAANVIWTGDAEYLDESTLFLLSGRAPDMPNVISYNNDLDQFASELYDRFRQADHKGYTQIAVELNENLSSHPMYAALLNRISKAVG